MKTLKNLNLPLINAHTHAPMIAFRGLCEDKPLDKWLKDCIWPKEKKLTPKLIRKYAKEAIKEMKKNKIVYFVDMYFFEEEVAKLAIKEKIGVLIGEGLLEFPTPSYKSFEEGLKITENLLKKYKNHPLVSASVAPHSIYTVSKRNLIKAKELAQKYNAIFQIHCSETKKEFELSLKKNRKTPVEYLDSLGILDENTLLFHCVWPTDKDIEILKKRKVAVVHCPLSNSKLASGIAPISKLIKNNVLVCLGTDGPASSNRLDIWEAGKYAALLQKAVTGDASVLPVKEVIKMMTTNGMKACRLKKIKGKTIKEWEKEINKRDFSFLYHLNFS